MEPIIISAEKYTISDYLAARDKRKVLYRVVITKPGRRYRVIVQRYFPQAHVVSIHTGRWQMAMSVMPVYTWTLGGAHKAAAQLLEERMSRWSSI